MLSTQEVLASLSREKCPAEILDDVLNWKKLSKKLSQCLVLQEKPGTRTPEELDKLEKIPELRYTINYIEQRVGKILQTESGAPATEVVKREGGGMTASEKNKRYKEKKAAEAAAAKKEKAELEAKEREVLKQDWTVTGTKKDTKKGPNSAAAPAKYTTAPVSATAKPTATITTLAATATATTTAVVGTTAINKTAKNKKKKNKKKGLSEEQQQQLEEEEKLQQEKLRQQAIVEEQRQQEAERVRLFVQQEAEKVRQFSQLQMSHALNQQKQELLKKKQESDEQAQKELEQIYKDGAIASAAHKKKMDEALKRAVQQAEERRLQRKEQQDQQEAERAEQSSYPLNQDVVANLDGSMPDFIPTHDWQPIKPGQAIPPGLKVIMDMESGTSFARFVVR